MYLRKTDNVLWLFALLVVILVLYIILFNYCTACSAKLEGKLIDQVTTEKYNFETKQLLKHINEQKNLCYHCLVNISSFDKLEKMIVNLEEQQQSEEGL